MLEIKIIKNTGSAISAGTRFEQRIATFAMMWVVQVAGGLKDGWQVRSEARIDFMIVFQKTAHTF